MTHTAENLFRVELKYCERCGGLWFRHEHSREVLCAPCTVQCADTNFCLPAASGTPSRKPPMRASATVKTLHAVARIAGDLTTGGAA